MAARTTHRSPTSAIETNCEHNLLTVRAPHDLVGVASCAALSAGSDGPFQSRGQPSVHGPRGFALKDAQPLSAAIARGESFSPARSARAPPVARLFPPDAGDASAKDNPPRGRDIHKFAQLDPARAEPTFLGPPHSLSREEERDPPHPRCLLLIGSLPKECALSPHAAVAGARENRGPAPFRSLRVLSP